MITLSPDETAILKLALDRMADDSQNCRDHMVLLHDDDDSMLAFAPGAVAYCFEGHLLVSSARVLGLDVPELIDEDWQPLWDLQERLCSGVQGLLTTKLESLVAEALPVTDEQMDERNDSSAFGPLAWANDVYGTQAVREVILSAIERGEIVGSTT